MASCEKGDEGQMHILLLNEDMIPRQLVSHWPFLTTFSCLLCQFSYPKGKLHAQLHYDKAIGFEGSYRIIFDYMDIIFHSEGKAKLHFLPTKKKTYLRCSFDTDKPKIKIKKRSTILSFNIVLLFCILIWGWWKGQFTKLLFVDLAKWKAAKISTS